MTAAAAIRVQAPTQAEFHEAIARRSDRWYGACLNITRDPDLAADALQDGLLSAWDKRHQFERGARLDTWIHRIAINAALMLLRKQRPQAWQPLPDLLESDERGPADTLADHELGKELDAALRCLSDLERICFVLKHLEQWRLAEIADELGHNLGTVKQAVFRAVKKMRGKMPALEAQT